MIEAEPLYEVTLADGNKRYARGRPSVTARSGWVVFEGPGGAHLAVFPTEHFVCAQFIEEHEPVIIGPDGQKVGDLGPAIESIKLRLWAMDGHATVKFADGRKATAYVLRYEDQWGQRTFTMTDTKIEEGQ